MKRSLPCLALLLLLALAQPVLAQQSAHAELDACVRAEQRSKARQGAVLGFLGGLMGGALGGIGSSRQDSGGSVGIQVGVGTAGGGALGWAVAYYTAVDTCLQKHPQWIPASQLLRQADYADTLSRHAYEPAQGPRAQALGIDGPAHVAPGTDLLLQGRLLLLTPLGDEASVEIERRFYVRADGEEHALRHLGHTQEQRVLSAGEHLDSARLPIPKELPAGVEFRYELIVRLAGQVPSAVVHHVLVKP